MSALPDKPSELLELAINDALEVEKMPGFELDMAHWVLRHEGWPCRVCLAGAVMVRRMGATNRRLVEPSDCDDEDDVLKLYALDAFRTGDVADALLHMGIPSEKPRDRGIPPYYHDRGAFFAALRQLVTDLREAGL